MTSIWYLVNAGVTFAVAAGVYAVWLITRKRAAADTLGRG